MLIVLVGESGSGKSTIQNDILSLGFEKVVTYTTRPKRAFEEDGVDYHFISESDFERMKDNDEFVETSEYNGWKYGSSCSSYLNKDKLVAVITPSGMRALKRKGISFTSFYIDVDRRTRLIEILKRGDNIEEAYRRSLSDVGQFDGIKYEIDHVIYNHEHTFSSMECALEILGVING